MGTYGENIDLSRGWPQYDYGRYYRGSVEQSLRDEITRLKERVAQLEGVKPSYEVRLFVNDAWTASFKASDKIRLVEHKFTSHNQDRDLYGRH